MDRGSWWTTVHGVTQSQTGLSDQHAQMSWWLISNAQWSLGFRLPWHTLMGFPLPLIFDFIPWWSSQGSDESGVSEAWPGPHHLRDTKNLNHQDKQLL